MWRYRTGARMWCAFWLLFCAALPQVWPGVFPYGTDAATLHLWTFDETAGPSSATNAVAGALPLLAIANGATLGNTGFSGFDRALSTYDGGPAATLADGKDAFCSALPLVNGSADNVDLKLADPLSGAFTFEAIVRIDFDPALNYGPVSGGGNGRLGQMMIFSGEDEANSGRLFQFRIDPIGTLTPANTDVLLKFNNVNLGATQPRGIPIPRTGPDAIASNRWYHVAVTYSGVDGAAEGLKFYWTLLHPDRTYANLIGVTNLASDLPVAGTDFCIGNTGRSSPNINFVGLIDEVRISAAARAADQFLFDTDADSDGLPDRWERSYFASLAACAPTEDPDGDGFSTLEEYRGGSNPANSESTPHDKDADGLPDVWETAHFGFLGYGPGDDPDGDNWTNAQEHLADTNPNDPSSNPADSDRDGLPDDWELAHFDTLAEGPYDDFDADGYFNLREWLEGTDPRDAESMPPGPAVRLVPVTDHDPTTPEYGNANAEGMNTASFSRSGLFTSGNQQFIVFYGRHPTDSSYVLNDRVFVGRRTLGTNHWEIFRTDYVSYNINDGHDTINGAVDGGGFLHLSWGMHGNAMKYVRTIAPATGSQPIRFPTNAAGQTIQMVMGGNIGPTNSVTYPHFLTLPDGDLLYVYRHGSSGAGDWYLNRYDPGSKTWTAVNTNAQGQPVPFLGGMKVTPNYNAYIDQPRLDSRRRLHLTWVWRYNGDSPAGEAGYQTNHDYNYGFSDDFGVTWHRFDGSLLTLPILEKGEDEAAPAQWADVVCPIPEGSSLMNQAGLCVDSEGTPYIANWWAPGAQNVPANHVRQQMVLFPTTNGWVTRQVSRRTLDDPSYKRPEGTLRDMRRPVIVCDAEDRLLFIYRDAEGSRGIRIAFTPPKRVDPLRLTWSEIDLSTQNLGATEPMIDEELWESHGLLHIFHQVVESPAVFFDVPPQPNVASLVSVLEWDPAAWSAHRPMLKLKRETNGADGTLSWRSQIGWDYRLWTCMDFGDWQYLLPFRGSGTELHHTHTNSLTGPRRFWRLELGYESPAGADDKTQPRLEVGNEGPFP